MSVPSLNINNIKPESSRMTFRNYKINNNIDKTDEDLDTESRMIDEFYTDLQRRASCASTQAYLYKIFTIMATIFITLSGSIIGLLNLIPFNNSNTTSTYSASNITNVVLGFAITIIKSLLSVFFLEKRAYQLKDASNKLRKYAREIKMLKIHNLPANQLLAKLEEIQTKTDELDLTLFIDKEVKNDN